MMFEREYGSYLVGIAFVVKKYFIFYEIFNYRNKYNLPTTKGMVVVNKIEP